MYFEPYISKRHKKNIFHLRHVATSAAVCMSCHLAQATLDNMVSVVLLMIVIIINGRERESSKIKTTTKLQLFPQTQSNSDGESWCFLCQAYYAHHLLLERTERRRELAREKDSTNNVTNPENLKCKSCHRFARRKRK